MTLTISTPIDFRDDFCPNCYNLLPHAGAECRTCRYRPLAFVATCTTCRLRPATKGSECPRCFTVGLDLDKAWARCEP